MSEGIIRSDRHFQMWRYSVSHSSLLLRSTKSDGILTRIDVLFKGVREFHLPTSFTGVSIAEAYEVDAKNLCSLRQSFVPGTDRTVFKVEGADFVGYVTALIAVYHEDEGEYHDPSFFDQKP